MKDEKDNFMEGKMKMWKMREELLNSMSEKELRAFIKGYMMGERKILKHLASSACGCQEGSCGSGSCSCGNDSCGCGNKECNCGKE